MSGHVPPDTRSSLLIRLANPDDQQAWDEFIELYYPAIYRAALLRGLQDADAQDVSQQVLVAVSKTLATRPHDSGRAKFRTWLSTVIRNAAINSLITSRQGRGTGDSAVHRALDEAEAREQSEEFIEREFQRELFQAASRRIEHEFAADTWQLFWRTAVVGDSIEQVAAEFGKQAGSVYAARSRIIRRLREEVERIEGNP